MRMLFLEQPLPQAAVTLWVKKEHSKEQAESQEVLLALRLWHPHTLPGGLPGVALHPNFRQNLRVALLGGGKAWSDDTSQLGPDKHARDVPALDKYAEERWEVILHFMVGSPSAAVSQDLAQLLIQAGLMKSEGGEAPCITSAGFQFLLLDTPAQLWYFVLQYLRGAEARGMDLVEILSFLFQLSFSTLGKDYSVEGMSESLLTFLQHLREFGLVFQRKRKSRRFYPTRLAIALASGTSGAPPRTRRSRLRPRRDQLPHLRLHRLGAADRPHRPFLRAPLPFPQPGGGPGDEGQRAGGHRQRHHRRPDHPFPPHPGAPRHGQADPGAASHHHRPDPPVGAGAGPAALLRGGAVQPVPVAGGFRGAAGPRAGAGGTGFRKPRETVDGGDPRRAPRRQTLLEKAETQRLKLAIDPGGGPLSPVSLPPPPGKHVRAVGSWGPPIPG
uniref:General transcription factor IIH subunit 4 n=1 Tax=Aquila chrysaetos chrysaetos TaxID=223781 RepID=A0A663EUL5_AQUCH